ncbi:MAG: SH3 domain-containing protein [Chloroflexota bacterium]|nr:SH3 domain-containing protein [Chloroflexota bacterium]
MGLLLVGCGGGGASVSAPKHPTPVARVSGATNTPTRNRNATATRAAEQAQLSALLTQTAPSTPTVAPAATNTPVPTATSIPPTSTGTTSSPTPMRQSARPTEFVSNIAASPINLRSLPDVTSDILAQIPAAAELLLLDGNVMGTDGASNWAKVTYRRQDGYVRNDLVGSPHAALPTTTTARSTKQSAPRNTAAPRSPIKRRRRASR